MMCEVCRHLVNLHRVRLRRRAEELVLCSGHLQAFQTAGEVLSSEPIVPVAPPPAPRARKPLEERVCRYPECRRPSRCNSLCVAHLWRVQALGLVPKELTDELAAELPARWAAYLAPPPPLPPSTQEPVMPPNPPCAWKEPDGTPCHRPSMVASEVWCEKHRKRIKAQKLDPKTVSVEDALRAWANRPQPRPARTAEAPKVTGDVGRGVAPANAAVKQEQAPPTVEPTAPLDLTTVLVRGLGLRDGVTPDEAQAALARMRRTVREACGFVGEGLERDDLALDVLLEALLVELEAKNTAPLGTDRMSDITTFEGRLRFGFCNMLFNALEPAIPEQERDGEWPLARLVERVSALAAKVSACDGRGGAESGPPSLTEAELRARIVAYEEYQHAPESIGGEVRAFVTMGGAHAGLRIEPMPEVVEVVNVVLRRHRQWLLDRALKGAGGPPLVAVAGDRDAS